MKCHVIFSEKNRLLSTTILLSSLNLIKVAQSRFIPGVGSGTVRVEKETQITDIF